MENNSMSWVARSILPVKVNCFSRPRMIGLALKMLFGDTAKYLMLVAGLFFATFLIVQQASVFCGLMRWTTATLKNVAAPIFVVEERVEQVNETNPMRDTDVARVRSVSAVRWAMPLYSGIQRVRLEDGSFKTVQLIGVDAASLAGAPGRMVEGNLEDLRLPNTVVIDELATVRLSSNPSDPSQKIKIGDEFASSAFAKRCARSPAVPTSGPLTSAHSSTRPSRVKCSPPSSPLPWKA
jgi:putative ABC transport system permease protein